MPEARTVRVKGATDLIRAFSVLDRNLGRGIKEALENAAEPVRSEAASLAQTQISGMARSRLPWWQMRTGSNLTTVYVAPQQRGVKTIGKRPRMRPNLATLLLGRAMEPALDNNADRVEDEVLETLDDLFRAWERI